MFIPQRGEKEQEKIRVNQNTNQLFLVCGRMFLAAWGNNDGDVNCVVANPKTPQLQQRHPLKNCKNTLKSKPTSIMQKARHPKQIQKHKQTFKKQSYLLYNPFKKLLKTFKKQKTRFSPPLIKKKKKKLPKLLLLPTSSPASGAGSEEPRRGRERDSTDGFERSYRRKERRFRLTEILLGKSV